MVTWAMMYLVVLMALRCHLEICQKYIHVRVICYQCQESQISQTLTFNGEMLN